MMQTAEECLAFLEEAREALDELSVLADREDQLEQDEDRIGKQLETEQKAVADAVQQTVKERREDINTSYDKEINKAQEYLKKARAKREKAKNQRVKDRIKDETAELHTTNQELRAQMRNLFRQNHTPGFCRSSIYYSLYFTKGLKEMLALLLFVVIAFFAIPFGVYLLIPERQPLYLAVIYLVDILVFGGIYMMIGNRTKVMHMETLREGRRIRDQIRSNDREIRRVTASIRRDRNDSLYNLEQYDDEIAQYQQELNDVAAKKKEALNTFETVTKNILQDEIEHNHKETLDQLKSDYEAVKENLRTTAAEVKEKRLYIMDHYGTYLGKEFLYSMKIAELCAIVQNGQASNVSEAIAVYKKQKEQ